MNSQDFENLIVEVLGEGRRPNARQRACIDSRIDTPTLIVAGPGSGKTSVLVLRALRHLLVDRIAPQDVLITTFTIKAAKEIRTRLLEWGEPLVAAARQRAGGDPGFARFLEDADVNRIITGTLDSVCQEALGEQRAPGERRYVVIEGFAADVLLSRIGQVAQERQNVAELNAYLSQYSMFAWGVRNNGEATRMIRTIIDRFVQDAVDVRAYINAPGPFALARQAIGRIYDRYRTHMLNEHRMDFALLESIFLERVREGRVPDSLRPLRAILVDEYQDTNPLQEQIYFELTRATGAALTVVGDDDQSLYRFRGATIELFRAFRDRALAALGLDAGDPLYLVENYRSSPEVVAFYNGFIAADPQFAPARIQPAKPAIVPNRPSQNMPILGIFREDPDELADAVADFLHQIFRGGGRPADAMLGEPIRAAQQHGDLGDAVLLGPTVAEFTHNGRERFPSLGLEYPLVIVDVSSDYRTNHHTQAFQRFPRDPSAPALMEDDLAAVTPIGPLRQQRTAMERSFEDIIRRSYVAYSRPQDLLVLVGRIQGLRYNSTIGNIGLCWRQDGSWAWRSPADPPPVLANHIPLVLI